MNKILVTGGAGFIGFNLCQRLLEAGNTVIAVDNLITSSGENIARLKKSQRFYFFKHDIVKPFPRKILASLDRVNFIYHLACPTGVPNLVKLSEEMLLTCSLGTWNILELAKINKARVIFTSSSEVYGNPLVFPQKESYNGNVDPIGLRSPYEEGKRFSEALITAYIRKYNLNASIVRLFNTYGPFMDSRDLRVIPRFITSIGKNKPLIIYGNGKQKRTFLYIDDLITGLVLVAEKGRRAEVYNIGSTKEITILNLAKLILKLTGKKNKIIFKKSNLADHARRLPSVSKIRKLGWGQSVNLEKGLKKTIDWFRKN